MNLGSAFFIGSNTLDDARAKLDIIQYNILMLKFWYVKGNLWS